MDYADMLASSRFYGAKSEAIDEVRPVKQAPAADGSLEILAVRHGGTTDYYQVLIDASGADILGEDATATEYGHALAAGVPAGFGTLHGDVGMLEDTETGRGISGEQSNTSLVYRDPATGRASVMIKVFRRLEPGLSPDVELLSRIPECPNVAPVRGWVTEAIDGEDYTLAMAQDYVNGGRDGWQLALDIAAAGDSFADEAHLLGQAIRGVHDHLARAFGTSQVPGGELAGRLRGKADEFCTRIPALTDHRDAVRQRYAQLGDSEVTVHRIHGDLHLGQVLRTDDRYVLIDFEGEPARPLAERRLPDSPLRDVAGMLRSLDYAAHFPGGQMDSAAWAAEASAALLAGYGVERSPLLEAYLLDKALYEVDYETNNRPDWAHIPLAAVERLVD